MNWKLMKENKLAITSNQIHQENENSYQPEINKTSKIIMSRTQAEVNRNIGRPEDAPFNRHEQL